MQTDNRLFDDLARVASGALNTLGGVRDEIEARVRERAERLANDLDLVSREEFEALREVAVEARAGQERLEARVEELEAAMVSLRAQIDALAAVPGKPAPAARKRKTPAKKPDAAAKTDGDQPA